MIDEEKIKSVARNIAVRFSPDKIILFGSWAWGNPGPDSDIDLFIIKETDDTRKCAMEIDGLIFPRTFPIDVIVSRPSEVARREREGDFFILDILKRGKVLYAA